MSYEFKSVSVKRLVDMAVNDLNTFKLLTYLEEASKQELDFKNWFLDNLFKATDENGQTTYTKLDMFAITTLVMNEFETGKIMEFVRAEIDRKRAEIDKKTKKEIEEIYSY